MADRRRRGVERAAAKPGALSTLARPSGRPPRGGRVPSLRPGFAPARSRLHDRRSTAQPISWAVVDERFARDDDGEPSSSSWRSATSPRTRGIVPDHELEHTLARRAEEELPEEATSLLDRADRLGQSVELVALEPGEAPDWDAGPSASSTRSSSRRSRTTCWSSAVSTRTPTRARRGSPRCRTGFARTSGSSAPTSRTISTRSRSGTSAAVECSRRSVTLGRQSDPGSGYGWMCRLCGRRGARRGRVRPGTQGRARLSFRQGTRVSASRIPRSSSPACSRSAGIELRRVPIRPLALRPLDPTEHPSLRSASGGQASRGDDAGFPRRR